LTNDGKLCSRITNPRHGIEKTYEAVLDAPLSREALSKLESGVEILLEENGRKKRYKTKGCKITECKPDFKTVHVTLSEGKKREVRRMFESLGLKVLRLARIAIGKISLEGSKLKEGCYTLLDRDFIQRRLT
jgi:pseudouridine synthase